MLSARTCHRWSDSGRIATERPSCWSAARSSSWSHWWIGGRKHTLGLDSCTCSPSSSLPLFFPVGWSFCLLPVVQSSPKYRSHHAGIHRSAVEGAVLRLRPIMMTMLVATLGLLPAATSHGIGSDSQRPFAIVIEGGLLSDLLISIFLLPTLYVRMAGRNDVLPEPEAEFDEAT